METMRKFVRRLIAICLVSGSTLAHAAVPATLNYQG
jgi:hypothetical protein